MVETRTQIRMWNIPFVGGHCLRTIKYASVLDVLLMDKVFRLLHLLFFLLPLMIYHLVFRFNDRSHRYVVA